MNEPLEREAPLVVATFLARYLADRETGTLLPLEDYAALYPGYEDVIRREFAALETLASRGTPEEPDVEGECIGRYRILRELGRGGQGVVYLARDVELGRDVALKVLPTVLADRRDSRQRFLREAEAASRLDHPGLCAVHERGTHQGIAFIAMRYVPGESLAHRIAREREAETPADRTRVLCLAIVERIERAARALHFAHEKGLVHRDVKPGNLMITPEGETVVLDFGLARLDEADALTLTARGDLLGTPTYMAPEQLDTRERFVDRRCDVYALGVTLHEALALEPPFQAATRERLFQQILEEEPTPLRRLVPRAPRDLEIVLGCALAKDPTQRYQTALDFAEDLGRVRRNEPIRARKPGFARRVGRVLRRHPTKSMVAALFILFLTVFAIWNGIRNRELSDGLDTIRRQRAALAERAERERAALRRSEGLRLAARARELARGDVASSLTAARLAYETDPNVDTRSTLLEILAKHRRRPQWNEGQEPAQWVEFSAGGNVLAVDAGDEIHLYDTEERHPRARIACTDACFARVALSPDGRRLLLVPDAYVVRSEPSPLEVHLHDATNGERLATLAPHDGTVRVIAWSDTGRYFLTGDGIRGQDVFGPETGRGADHAVRVFESETGSLVREFEGHGAAVLTASFRGSDRAEGSLRIVSHGHSNELREWNLKGEVLARHTLEADVEHALPNAEASVFAHSGSVLLRASLHGTEQYHVKFGRKHEYDWIPKRFLASRRGPFVLALPGFRSPGHPASDRGPIYVLDAERKMPRTQLATHSFVVLAATFTGNWDEEVLVVTDEGSLVRYGRDGEELERVAGFGRKVRCAAFAQDPLRVALITEEGALHSWRVDRPTFLPNFGDVPDSAWSCHDDSGRFVFVPRDRGFLVFDLVDRRIVLERRDLPRTPRFAVFDASAARLAIVFQDESVQVHLFPSGELVRTFENAAEGMDWLRFATDGDALMLGGEKIVRLEFADGTVVPSSGATPATPEPSRVAAEALLRGTGELDERFAASLIGTITQEGFVQHVARDGRLALRLPLRRTPTGHINLSRKKAALLDLGDGEVIRSLEMPEPIACGHLARSGEFAAIGTVAGTIQVFETRSGRIVATLEHEGSLEWVAITDDGSRVISASGDAYKDPAHANRVRLFDVRTGGTSVELSFSRDGIERVDLDPSGLWFAVQTKREWLHLYPCEPQLVLTPPDFQELTREQREAFLR